MKMSNMRQNLFLFFDESEYGPDCSSNIAKLAMNRFIVDEDAQFEVIGVYYLQPANEPMMNDRSKDFRQNLYIDRRIEKWMLDQTVILHALYVASSIQTKSARSHFIFGSYFYSFTCAYFFDTIRLIRIPRLCEWILDLLSELELNSLQCTFYHSERIELITQQHSSDLFSGFTVPFSMIFSSRFENASPKPSVNDDLEQFLHEIQNNKQRKENFTCSYLHPMLTQEELQEIKNEDSSFWTKVCNKRSRDIDSQMMSAFPKFVPHGIFNFIDIRCKRYSVVL